MTEYKTTLEAVKNIIDIEENQSVTWRANFNSSPRIKTKFK